MTISTTTNRVSFAGNGSTTAFATGFKFFADGDLTVILVVDSTGVETTQTITTNYTVSGSGADSGGTVTMVTAPASGETLVIIRSQAYTQSLDLVENDPFPSESVEEAFDKTVIMNQQLEDAVGRSFQLSDGDTSGVDITIPAYVADQVLGVTTAGTALEFKAALAIGDSQPDGIIVNNAGTISGRTITGTANEIAVADGDGTGGNPTISLPSTIALAGKTVTTDNTSDISFRDGAAFDIQNQSDATKQFRFNASGITTGTTRTLTAPDADTTLVGTGATQTLTNKTIDFTDNTVTFTTSELDAALSDSTAVVSGNGVTLTNKTIALGSNTVSGTFAEFNTAVTDATLVSTTGTETLTNKTFGGATMSGTLDADGQTIILDADGDTNIAAGTDDVITLTAASSSTMRVGLNSVSIDTTDTTSKLNVSVGSPSASTDNFGIRVRTDNALSDLRCGIFFQPSTADEGGWIQATNSGSNGDLLFGTKANGASPVEHMRLNKNGKLIIGDSSVGTENLHVTAAGTGAATEIVAMSDATPTNMIVFYTSGDGSLSSANAAAACQRIGDNSSTGRSINASGTINASGADYAEYERIAEGSFSKGDIVGYNEDGLLTDKFADAVTFGIKSTNPSYVGGDTWGADDYLGMDMPQEPQRGDDETDEEFDTRMATYGTDKATYDALLEAERVKWDRVAYAGKVPINGADTANPGDWIVPVADGDGIKASIVTDAKITAAQYRKAVGQVRRIAEDGRAVVAVKVA